METQLLSVHMRLHLHGPRAQNLLQGLGSWGVDWVSLVSFFKTANSQGQLLITNVRNIAISMAKYLQGSN